MKKIFTILVLFVIVLSSTACSKISVPARDANEYIGKTKMLSKTESNIRIFKNIVEISDVSDLIVKAKLMNNEGVFNTSEILRKKGYTDVGTMSIYTFYEMEVLEVLKGDIKIGDKIEIRIWGGVYEDTLYSDKYAEELTTDFDYILFLEKSDYEVMPYHVTSYYQGYLPLKDNKLSLHKKIENNLLFTNGESEEQIINKIKNNMSTKEDLANEKTENELKAVKNSLSPSEISGVTIYKDGYKDEFIKYQNNTEAPDLILSFLRSVNPKSISDNKPDEQIYHIGIYDNVGKIYMTITITDTAILYNEKWYLYNNASDKKISNIYSLIQNVK